MGDPRKARKKYKGPSHPWQKTRIDEERVIKKQLGLKNKKEIWKAVSAIRKIKSQAKNLISEKAKNSKQALIEEKQLLSKLKKYGLLKENTLEALLNLQPQDIFSRRLQTIVHKKGLSLTAKQARQFIIHGHIFVNERKVTVPSYIVSIEEENTIIFNPSSSFNDPSHPERNKEKKTGQEDIKKEEIKEEIAEEKVLEKIEKELVAEVTE